MLYCCQIQEMLPYLVNIKGILLCVLCVDFKISNSSEHPPKNSLSVNSKKNIFPLWLSILFTFQMYLPG